MRRNFCVSVVGDLWVRVVMKWQQFAQDGSSKRERSEGEGVGGAECKRRLEGMVFHSRRRRSTPGTDGRSAHHSG